MEVTPVHHQWKIETRRRVALYANKLQECTLVASNYFLVHLFAEDSQSLPLVSAYLLIGLFAIAFSYISILVDKYEPSRCQVVCTYATYTVSQKTRHQTLGRNFTNYYPIFKLFSLANSAVNLQQIHCLNIPLRFKHVATLPCEIWMQKNGIILKYVLLLMMNHKVV